MTRLARLVAALVAVLGGTSPAFAIGHGYSGSAPASSADWSVITGFPSACSAGSFIQQLGSPTNTCASNASTATALAANGANCSANQAAGGVDASGAAESCITPLLSPGAVTTNALVKFSGAGGQSTAQSTCTESAGAISGCSLSGNASTATALAANGTNCSAGSYPLGVDASGNAESCTVASNTLLDGVNHTDTTSTTFNQGDLIVRNGSSKWVQLAKGTNGQFLRGDGTTVGYGTNLATGAADGTLAGSDTTARKLTLRANNADTTSGTIEANSPSLVLYPSQGTLTAAGPENVVTFSPTFTMGGASSPALTVFDMSPTVTINGYAGAISGIKAGGSWNATASVGLSSWNLFNAATQVSSSTAAVAPPQANTFIDSVIYQTTNVAMGTVANPGASFSSQRKYKANGGSGTATLTTAIGFDSVPKVVADTAGGSMTVTGLTHYHVADVAKSGAGTTAVTTQYGLRVDDLSSGTTNIPIQAGSGAGGNRLAANTIIGINSSSPSTTLHVKNTTANSTTAVEAFRIENGNGGSPLPGIRYYEASKQSIASAATTNFTLAVTASQVLLVEAWTACHCTAGSACTAQDGAANVSVVGIKNNGGTCATLGAVSTPLATQTSITALTIALTATSCNAQVAVVNGTNYTTTCHVTFITKQVGT